MQMPLTDSQVANRLAGKFSVPDLLVHALVMELEAMQSYKDLAELMELSGNTEVAKIFAKMSDIEAKHATHIDEQLSGIQLPELTPWDYRWRGLEAPENIDRACLRSLMTPRQALSLALENERRAYEFFDNVVGESSDEQVQELAAKFAAEEEQHVAWVEEWLTRALTTQ